MKSVGPSQVLIALLLLQSAVLSATDADALRQAETAYNNGQTQASQQQVYAGLEKYPASYLKPDFLTMLAATYLKSGEPDQAEVVLRGLKSMYPRYETDPTARSLEAAIYESRGDFQRAQQTLLDAATDGSLYQSASLLEKTGQSFAAVSRLRDLEQKFPDTPLMEPARLALAHSYFRLREFDAATQTLEKINPAEKSARDIKHYLLGAIAYRQDNREKGNEELTAISDGSIGSSAAVLRGMNALKANNLTEAETAFSVALSSNSLVAGRAALGMVEVYFKSKTPEKAVTVVNTALPRITNAGMKNRLQLVRGIALQQMDKPSEALQDFEDVARNGTNEWKEKGLVLFAHGLWANNELVRLTKDFPALPARSDGLPLLFVADGHYQLRQYKQAEQIYRDVLSKTPPPQITAQAVSGLVACLVLQKKFDAATKELDQLMVRFGEDRDVLRFALLSQAHLLWSEGKYEPAAAQYERFTQMFSDHEKAPLTLYQWGRCQEKAGRKEKALEVWTTLRQKHPNSPQAFKSLLRSALLAESLGDRKRANEFYAEMARSDNSTAAELALLQLATNALSANNPVQAIRALNEFHARFPNSMHRRKVSDSIQQAYVLAALTESKTLESLSKEFENTPFGGETLYQQALRQYEKKEFAKASALFKQVWSKYPRTPSAAPALFYQGECAYQTGSSEAIGLLRQFTSQFPEHDLAPVARLHRGRSLVQNGYLDEAAMAYDEISRASPLSNYAATALLDLATVYEKKNDPPSQARTFELFLTQFPQHPKANTVVWRLGQLVKKQGALEKSLAYYRRVQPETGVATRDELDHVISDLEKLIGQEPRQ